MIYAVIGLSIALAAALAACVHFWHARQSIVVQRDRLTTDLSLSQQNISLQAEQITRHQADLAERDRDITQLRQHVADRDVQLAQLRTKLDGMDEKFRVLAQDVLKQANEQFLQLAEQKFKGEQKDASAQLEQRKAAIDAMLKPIRESLDKHAEVVGKIEKDREGAYQGLRQLVGTLVDDQKTLRGETANLVKALRRPEVRGRWGEMQMRRVAEYAGMIERCDFTEQVTGSDSDGRARRPDMVVNLPAGRQIVVDSKAPINAYLDAIACDDDAQREVFFLQFVRHVEEKISDLASKDYQQQFARSPDFVILFLPGESFLQAALQRKSDLMELAFNRNIVLATPSTLIALLKAVAMGWREEQVAQSAQKVNELGMQLHSRIATLCSHLDNLGKAVGKTVEHYNKFVGSYETQVMVSARRFKEFGADSNKELPAEGALPVVVEAPRELKAIEGQG